MKKLMVVLIAHFLAIYSFFVPHVNSFASAEYEESPIMVSEIKSELVSLLSSDARIIRKGGSDGEKNTLEYILSNLAGVSGLTAINNGYFNAGKQIVDFEDSDGFSKSTYNVGIRYPSTNASAKTISILTNVSNTPIITYSYDSNGNAKKNYNYVEAVNESAGSVAMMMAMAKYLANNSFTFNFNIDFIFCGAGDENSCGAQAYKRSISQDISKNPLIICLNKITVGDYNYFYAQDFSSEYEKYVAKYLNSGYGFKEFNKTTALVNNYSTNNEMAFAHAGIEGPAEVFADTAFNLVSIFSGNYNGISSLGRPESSTHAELTNTILDTTAYIEIEYKRNVANNLGLICASTLKLISSEEFEANALKLHSNLSKTNIANNEALVLFISGISVVLMFVVYYAIYSSMIKKSKKRMSSEQLASVVMQITRESNIGANELKEKIEEKVEEDTSKNNEDDKQ
ncbi:MAG: M28 family peptidase [Clostridia bacterium]|nr:M28 family peptidase [Clostridia bacterium]